MKMFARFNIVFFMSNFMNLVRMKNICMMYLCGLEEIFVTVSTLSAGFPS